MFSVAIAAKITSQASDSFLNRGVLFGIEFLTGCRQRLGVLLASCLGRFEIGLQLLDGFLSILDLCGLLAVLDEGVVVVFGFL